MSRRIICLLCIVLLAIVSCKNADYDGEFEKLCKDRTPDNWMNMRPMIDGKFTSESSCWGCMSDDGMSHFCSMEEYEKYLV